MSSSWWHHRCLIGPDLVFFFSTNPGCFSCTRLWWYIMCLHCSFTALDSPTETHCCGSVAGPALATQCQSVPLPSFSKLCCRLENILFLTPHVHIKTYIICSTCLYFHFKLVLLLEIIFSYNTSELLLIQADLCQFELLHPENVAALNMSGFSSLHTLPVCSFTASYFYYWTLALHDS